ncbi:unnamed protein product [Polarella glacialis]|uniref:Methyltransferase domain-containing protein n=1 Tax=Polarella glacialis TaxID=89957 RepID=A0A813KWM0_POLGL|nr:unnamed protein product [Polarella glacialis]
MPAFCHTAALIAASWQRHAWPDFAAGPRHKAARRALPRVRVEDGPEGSKHLLVDETFASLYRPGQASTGCVWDALAAPLLALPSLESSAPRVLILGLGGGSAARTIRALAPRAEIVGVEFDEAVVEAARSHFELDALGVEVVIGCALDFLQKETRCFDMVVDDVFIGSGRSVHKPSWCPKPFHDLAVKRVVQDGLLISNTIDEAKDVASGLRRQFPGLLKISVKGYCNHIFVAGPKSLDARALRSSVHRSPVLAGSLSELRFRVARSRRVKKVQSQARSAGPRHGGAWPFCSTATLRERLCGLVETIRKWT